MLVFLIDQTQLLSCKVYQKAKEKAGPFYALCELFIAFLFNFEINNWDEILNACAFGF